MPISALVLTMSRDESRREQAMAKIQKDARLTLGELADIQLPLVVETRTASESIELVRDELPEIDGVDFVHVISVDFSDMESRDEKLPKRRKGSKSRGTR